MWSKQRNFSNFVIVMAAGLGVGALILFKDSGILRSLDLAVYGFAVDSAKQSWTLWIWQILTALGEGLWLYPALAAVFLVGLWQHKSKKFACFIVFSVLIFAINPVLKWLLATPRPALIAAQLVEESSHGFPSGHSTNAVFLVFVLLPLLQKVFYNKSIGFSTVRRFGGIVLIVLIGLSRLMLGFHWASDVLAGWIVGAVGSRLILSRMESL